MAASAGRTFCVDPFCIRQFEDDSYSGTRLAPVSITEFEDHINTLWDAGKARSLRGTAEAVARMCTCTHGRCAYGQQCTSAHSRHCRGTTNLKLAQCLPPPHRRR
eukprot:scaffold17835_cov129-Isochrysis_galbana.AAC.3